MIHYGPYHQEALGQTFELLKQDVKDICDLGVESYAVNLVTGDGPTEGLDADPGPFRHAEMTNVRNGYRRKLDWLVNYGQKNDVNIIVYGIMGPAIRRGQMIPSMFRGTTITDDDWKLLGSRAGIAEDGWLHFARWVRDRYGDSVQYVDGVEPYYGALHHPPNGYTAMMQQVWGTEIYTAGGSEHHINPPKWDWRTDIEGAIGLDNDVSYYPAAGSLVVTDGWGASSHQGRKFQLTHPDGTQSWQKLAGLPGDGITRREGESRKDEQDRVTNQIRKWFKHATLACKAANADGFLVLHTPRWNVRTYAEAKAGVSVGPGSGSALDGPFKRIYKTVVRNAA